ncbi:dTDP-glucose 4,6-dehydratase [Oleidesulfovibrio alaskensis G20]|jgi:dTDP-glucose 4,6-dehydratase|uniref:dTDP-glucose 4,6-dehydratase n=1 Tax=Oleidesulfovibrio alaskensis (strain ATCC BAA-1058 / DSM 17464 / G20) TaxID=207559 RepID=Q30ZB7_OLEA2|nr:dTDP-glucose 4,6-dehydratase [Oleidesulfovibrio alaskensis]ABB38979.1 dTDP-glucose 4,6-dehydratase [Oleidesulfovibrio alaskensis G20]MBG0772238.1 dTDP-glucose 4,6-dehydratase [Oleidesulfovibrio alaskensis]MBL3583333.1 dTDP-glucose 4,6-dehydratase [Oleidesulfovibrio alaskensis]
MRLLVTGGCGFIGTNFIRYQLNVHPQTTIVNLDKLTYAGNPQNLTDIQQAHGGTRYFFEKADIADAAAVQAVIEKYSPDAVLNFAAESHVDRSISDPAPFVTTNVLGTQVLMQAARTAGIKRFVHISTDEVYGSLLPHEAPFTESNPLLPNSPYSASKAGADLMVRAFVETYGFPAIITRCSNNYGPYQFPEKLIPLMLGKAWENAPLPVYGDGTNVRDWIHVEDHCRGIDLALRKGRDGAVYNFGGNAERTNLDVVRAILRLTGKPESLISFVKDRPGHDRRYAMDFTLAGDELGYAPVHDFETGLADTLAWYEKHTTWLENVKSGAYLEFMSRWYGDR